MDAVSSKHAGAASLSLLAHALLLYALGRYALLPRPAKPAPARVVWLETPVRLAPMPAELSRPQPSAPESVPQRTAERETLPRQTAEPEAGPDHAPETETERDAAAESTAPTIDWAAERERAVAAAIERQRHEATLRQFGFADVSPAGPPAEPGRSSSIFDSVSAGRAGITYRDSFGVTIRWISDTCYSQSGTGSLFARFETPMVICTRRTPRRDLFKDIRPSYLPEFWQASP